jgi:serine O-acetyltransferase
LNAKSIGDNCTIQSGVVIGGKELAENKPVVGNNVNFGLGCKIYGKITIGDNAYILPNAVVTHDVPTNAIVGGVPAKVIKYRNV